MTEVFIDEARNISDETWKKLMDASWGRVLVVPKFVSGIF